MSGFGVHFNVKAEHIAVCVEVASSQARPWVGANGQLSHETELKEEAVCELQPRPRPGNQSRYTKNA